MSPAGSNAPNVVLVVLDTARADHFGPWGAKAPTPAFDAFAEGGAVAPNVVATSPWTVPSHASMFSGLLPFEHGLTGAAAQTSDGRVASLAPAVDALAAQGRWLPQVMRDAGYSTIGVSANVWITPQLGFDRGFDRFTPVGMARVAPRGGAALGVTHAGRLGAMRRRAKRAVRYLRDARHGRDFGAAQALPRLSQELRVAERPFFCFVNLMEAHAPYLPPSMHNPLSLARRIRAPALLHRYLADEAVLRYNIGASEVPDSALATFRDLYRGEIAYLDAALESLLGMLADERDDTLVIVTADHGEHLGEGHLLGHQLSVARPLVHVPLVVRGPGVDAASIEDAPVRSLASLPGLIATSAGLGDVFAVPDPAIAVTQYEGGANHVRRAASIEQGLSEAQRIALRTPIVSATDGRTTVTRSESIGERVEGPEAAAAALRSHLDGLPAAPTDRGAVSPTEESEIEDRLRDLGYL